MTKKRIEEEMSTLYVDGCIVEDVIKELQALLEVYGKGNVTLSKERYAYEDGNYIAVKVSRAETDEEEKIREHRESVTAERVDAESRRQYELLKKKFG